ncbi:MAG: citrate synthase [Actinomycetota bacterium]|nr:citrate synthase [Actinomycetota bacterium]
MRDAATTTSPEGLDGVVVAATEVGDVRGREGYYHYRQYSAVELAERRSFEDVWYLMVHGELPDAAQSAAFSASVSALRELPPGLDATVELAARHGDALAALRTVVSDLGARERWAPTHDIDAEQIRHQSVMLGAVVPTILAAAHRRRAGLEPIAPRPDLGHAANYLWMLTGAVPAPEVARAVEQYMILTIDHGFNASTFTARVITSTGADVAAAICGAIGALSGPLHGGAPSRALDMLDAIGSPEHTDDWVRAAVRSGERIMGFGHRVYKTDDPRSTFLRDVARGIGGDQVEFATQVERTVVDVLAELKPGRELYTNVEFYAGVVMNSCGIPREMFTPTFAAGRVIGWSAHILEQAASNRIIRPSAIYRGTPPPVAVPLPG